MILFAALESCTDALTFLADLNEYQDQFMFNTVTSMDVDTPAATVAPAAVH